jgi:hypothetical protein
MRKWNPKVAMEKGREYHYHKFLEIAAVNMLEV